MEFGIAFKGDLDHKRMLAISRQVEAGGFDYIWFFDSHIIWSDPYTQIAASMQHTDHVRYGPLVTNPRARDWSVAASIFATLNRMSGGRMEMAVGRGDSSMRVMGKKPATLARLIEFVNAMRSMTRGDSYEYEHSPNPVFMDWTEGHELPVWIAAYGPKALKVAGEHGDGLIIQLADPGLCQWFTEQAKAGGEAAGRDMSKFRVLSCAPVWVGDVEKGIQQTSWFPAVVGNHVADIVEKYGKDTDLVPDSFTEFIETRQGKGADEGYDYRKHAVKDSDNLYYVNNAVTESFCIVGPPEAHVEKLKKLEAAGVTQFTIYLTQGDEERLVAEYVDKIIPHFK
ncbi:MAG: TIGR03842 family LLM class F420-dependent oxidoreductase [Rhodospirillales bacterium]|jgi:probable F420-dependent oxidoreductase|nr:TIGR03842 family LLM class F420-dependent oxidoreductase [Rhodospirillales bacterium]MDP6646485.1 TIGR03842 family LLM class F420-dependent oxidoreductase [Rhodospirillales bacterium]MDP6842306.1 TIGR03842 family LLM class F420-dependent oxidoreductase [Rhodospirillales bacterium]